MQFSSRTLSLLLALGLLAAGAAVTAQLSPEDALAKMKAKEEARKVATQASAEDITVVRAVNTDLKKENTALKTENTSLRADNERLKNDNDKLRKELSEARRNARGGTPGSTIFEGLDKEAKKN